MKRRLQAVIRNAFIFVLSLLVVVVPRAVFAQRLSPPADWADWFAAGRDLEGL